MPRRKIRTDLLSGDLLDLIINYYSNIIIDYYSSIIIHLCIDPFLTQNLVFWYKSGQIMCASLLCNINIHHTYIWINVKYTNCSLF